jgi:cell division transport system permease protein
VFSCWSSTNFATPEGDQASALFGNFAIGFGGYAGVALVVVVIGALTAATSHMTVVSYLTDIEIRPEGN